MLPHILYSKVGRQFEVSVTLSVHNVSTGLVEKLLFVRIDPCLDQKETN